MIIENIFYLAVNHLLLLHFLHSAHSLSAIVFLPLDGIWSPKEDYSGELFSLFSLCSTWQIRYI